MLWAAHNARPRQIRGLRGARSPLFLPPHFTSLDEKLSIAQAIQLLSEGGVSAVALLGEIPEDAIHRADQVSLPLFSLPAGTSLSEVEQSINRFVNEYSRTSYQAEQEKYRQLTEMAIDGQGLDAIVRGLGRSRQAAGVEDERFR